MLHGGHMSGQKRAPKPGCFFSGLKITGLLSKILGGLICLGGLLIQIYYSITLAPDLMDILLNFKGHSQLGGFLLGLIIVDLGLFSSITCSGLVLFGLGFLFNLLSTKPIERKTPIDKPISIA
jgi:hypothetical protein